MQLLGAELEHATVFGHSPGNQQSAAAEHVHVASELSRVMNHHSMRSAARMFDDFHRALLHHEEERVAITLLEEKVAGVNLAGVTPGGKRGQVFSLRMGKATS